jgi:hypothetical protein
MGLQEIFFLFLHLFPLFAGCLDGGHFTDLGDDHVPPALVTRDAHQTVVLNNDDRGAVGGAHFLQGGHKFSISGGTDDVRAQTVGVFGEIDREIFQRSRRPARRSWDG